MRARTDRDARSRQPGPSGRGGRLFVAGLAALALAQVALIAYPEERHVDSPERWAPRFIEVGDTLSFRAVALGEANSHLSANEAGEQVGLVVLAFSSDCAHSRAVASRWREWLEETRDIRVLAVTRDPADAAAAYGQAEGWDVEIVSFPDPPFGSLEAALTRLTPAIYLADPERVVRYHGHGALLDALDDAVAALATPAVTEESPPFEQSPHNPGGR